MSSEDRLEDGRYEHEVDQLSDRPHGTVGLMDQKVEMLIKYSDGLVNSILVNEEPHCVIGSFKMNFK